ncbi:uncharacterized protein LOC124354664 isoform X2 [Homalodisca vitripennis]|uniref:uncharacterized protein LOC124354664 isoform X2 n=1 Tax=Homalodisca vitripennis TaxID=197043 RepID=UPI001EEC1171|nr:uncharacterized protein LOC124354664 isoform X2 [Homalodisca vitripennis]
MDECTSTVHRRTRISFSGIAVTMRLGPLATLLLVYGAAFIQTKAKDLPLPCEGCNDQEGDRNDDAETQVKRILKFLGACKNLDDCFLPTFAPLSTTSDVTTATTITSTTSSSQQKPALCNDLHACGHDQPQNAKDQVINILKFLGACRDPEGCFLSKPQIQDLQHHQQFHTPKVQKCIVLRQLQLRSLQITYYVEAWKTVEMRIEVSVRMLICTLKVS